MTDAFPHEEQATAISHLEKLGELLSTHPNTEIRLQWLPKKTPFIGFQRVRQLAFEAIHTAAAADLNKPHSIKKLKDTTKRVAITKWGEVFHNNPRTSMAYRTALQNPPDGKTHHTFNVTQTTGEGHREAEHNRDRQAKVKFSRLSHSTLLRYITGHTFVGEYTQRFYPPHTQDQIACPCGKHLQTIEHVLNECPLYTAARRRHLTANGRPRTLSQLFTNSKHVEEVLCFLEETGACAKPRTRWEPG